MNTHLTSLLASNPEVSEEVQALVRLQDRLMNASRLATVGEMAAGIAHEINQPLAAIANYAQACKRLLRLPEPDIAEVCDALQEITAEAVRAGEIIRKLRGFARIEPGRRETTDVNALLQELTDWIQSDARAHNALYQLELTANLPCLDIDRAQIQQVVLNLVRNAFESLAATAIASPQVIVRSALAPDGEHVEISVCDNGEGVSQAILKHLFAPFCTTKSAGTGLGLAMSRTIARAHEGTLDYRPNEPTGSCFTLRLPVPRSVT